MALAHTIIVPTERATLGIATVLAVQQGGYTPIQTYHEVQQAAILSGYCRMSFVWNGEGYVPIGHKAVSSQGWAKYSQEHSKFVIATAQDLSSRMIPIKDRIGFYGPGRQAWGNSPEDRVASVGATSIYANDYAVFGNSVVILDSGNNRYYTWAYPFTSTPVVAGTPPSSYARRLCELGGQIYTVWIDNLGAKLALYKVTNGYPVLVGTPSSHTMTNHLSSTCSRTCLFKFNNKLFFMVPNIIANQQKMRLFEFNVTTGTSVELTAPLPLGWSGTYASNDGRCFEVRDDINPTEQVFIFWHSNSAWECYEFSETAFISVASGTEKIIEGAGGVVYDPTAKAAHIKSAADSVPSDHVSMQIETFDKYANGLVDIDPRYRWNFSEVPPYPQCTEKSGVGSEGVTNLSTKPSGITTLADLSDDFDDSVINPNLWERVTQTYAASLTRDYGGANSTNVALYTLAEVNSAIRFGRAGDSPVSNTGVGVRSKWRINGAFTLDFTLADPENLISSSFGSAALIVLVRTTVNEGYGFAIWRGTSPPYYFGRALYMTKDGNFTYSTDETVADGYVIRIARDASNNWSVIFNQGGTPVDKTPVAATYSEPVEIVMGGTTQYSGHWVAGGTPAGSEPGIKKLEVTGAGAVGRYQGGVKHLFAWDHVTDLGTGLNGAAELYVDTQRT